MASCNTDCNCDFDEDKSILESIKNDLGASEWDDAFDGTLIRYINSAFMILNQLGVGPSSGFKITSKEETWGDYNPNIADAESVKSYISKKVKLMFDPSSSSITNEADKAICDELEWRLNVAADPG